MTKVVSESIRRVRAMCEELLHLIDALPRYDGLGSFTPFNVRLTARHRDGEISSASERVTERERVVIHTHLHNGTIFNSLANFNTEASHRYSLPRLRDEVCNDE